jgi:hypothetical protein
MLKQLCAGHEMEILLLIVILVISIGKGSGMLLLQLLKRLTPGHGDLNVNFGTLDRRNEARDRVAMVGDRISMADDRQHMADDRDIMTGDRRALASDRAVLLGHACQIPEDCPKHGEESQRSLQNKNDIAELKKQHHEDRNIFFKELKGIRGGITCITNGLLAKQIIDPKDLPRED